jgi:hypothetical protein
MIYIKRFNLCFVEIPKTASKAIRDFMIEELIDESEDVFTANMYETHQNSRYIIRNKLAPSNAKFIGVIREPLERQLSAYLFIWKRLFDLNLLRGQQTEPSLQHFKRVYEVGRIDGNGRPAFWEFMNKTGAESQSSYINRGLNREFWLYENLEDHIEDFKKEYNIRSDAFLKKINLTREDDTIQTKSLIDKFYDDELKDIIQKQYADDFKLYNELKNARSAR